MPCEKSSSSSLDQSPSCPRNSSSTSTEEPLPSQLNVRKTSTRPRKRKERLLQCSRISDKSCAMRGRVKVGKVGFGSGESPCGCARLGECRHGPTDADGKRFEEHLGLKSTLKACLSCGTCNMVVWCLSSKCKKRFLTRMVNP